VKHSKFVNDWVFQCDNLFVQPTLPKSKKKNRRMSKAIILKELNRLVNFLLRNPWRWVLKKWSLTEAVINIQEYLKHLLMLREKGDLNFNGKRDA